MKEKEDRMRTMSRALPGVLLLLLSLVPAANAKKFRYSSGPKPPEDSTLAVANSYLEPVVRSKGPRVPYTNLQLTQFVADTAVTRALAGAVVDSGTHAVLAPAREHPLNFVLEHAMLKALARRGVDVTVRRTPIPDDSLKVLFGSPGDPVVEYTLGSARVTYLRFVGMLPGRVKIERQALITGSISMRDPNTSRVLWTGDLGQKYLVAQQIVLTNEGIEFASRDATGHLAWNTYRYYLENRWSFFVWHPRGSLWFMFPKREFPSQSDLVQFRTILQTNLKPSRWFFH